MKVRPQRKAVERLFAEVTGVRPETAHNILRHNKILYKQWVERWKHSNQTQG